MKDENGGVMERQTDSRDIELERKKRERDLG
jgi:hypothetical protein